jgi:DNA-binding response OmpR family regulator
MVVAVVEHSEGFCVALARLLNAAGLEVAVVQSAEACLAAALRDVRCLSLDVHLPGMSGVDLIRTIRQLRPRTSPIILVTAD